MNRKIFGVLVFCIFSGIILVGSNVIGQGGEVARTVFILEGEFADGDGIIIARGDASEKKTRLLQTDETATFNLRVFRTNTYAIQVQYSNENNDTLSSETLVLRRDGNIIAQLSTQDTNDWNVFAVTTSAPMQLPVGNYTLTLSPTGGDGFGIEIDHIAFIANTTLPAPPGAENWSYYTTCEEEDNLNLDIWRDNAANSNTPGAAPNDGSFSMRVVATHPNYDIERDYTEADFSGCHTNVMPTSEVQSPGVRLINAVTCKDEGNGVTSCEISQDGYIYKAYTDPQWYRPSAMTVIGPDNQPMNGMFHRFVIHRITDDMSGYPEFFALYEDGYLRLKALTVPYLPDTVFGTSVVIGPAVPSLRPFADIEMIEVSIRDDPARTPCLHVTYIDGEHAQLCLDVNHRRVVVDVIADYDTQAVPAAIMRSMYVDEMNNDAAFIRHEGGDESLISDWSHLSGRGFTVYRTEPGFHNTSAPDILVQTDTAPVWRMFRWTRAENDTAQSYRFVLWNADSNTVLFDETLQASMICQQNDCELVVDFTLVPFGLLDGDNQLWAVDAALSAPLLSDWTLVASEIANLEAPKAPDGFTMNANQGRPSLKLPYDSNALWYHVAAVNEVGAIVHNQWYESSANGIIHLDMHPTNGRYEFWVQAWGPAGFSVGSTQGWAGAVALDIDFPSPPLVQPMTMTTASGSRPVFRWQSSASATWYQLWVGTGAPDWQQSHFDWHSAIDLGCANSGTCRVILEQLPVGSELHWYVRAWGPGGFTSGGDLDGWSQGYQNVAAVVQVGD